MVDIKTIAKATDAHDKLIEARRILEDLKEIERGEWVAGHGAKPHRMSKLECMIGDVNEMCGDLDRLWA